jgi:NifU-like protein involved in Fe-S cluster formation
MYSQKYIEHFSKPRNIGTVENADIVCNVINTEGGCFDNVDVFVRSENGRIKDFKYKLKACSGTITAFSLLSEVIADRTAEELDSITFEYLDGLLGTLPEKKHHSLRLAIEAKEKIKEKLKKII